MVVLAGQHGHTVMVTYPYAYMTIVYRVTTCRPGRGHIVAAAHLQLVIIVIFYTIGRYIPEGFEKKYY